MYLQTNKPTKNKHILCELAIPFRDRGQLVGVSVVSINPPTNFGWVRWIVDVCFAYLTPIILQLINSLAFPTDVPLPQALASPVILTVALTHHSFCPENAVTRVCSCDPMITRYPRHPPKPSC